MHAQRRTEPLSSATFDEQGTYYIHADPRSSHQQIARMIRHDGRGPILDVGAAYGFLGQILEPDGRVLDAIEPSPEWAEHARRFYRHVYQCSVEDAPLEPSTYPVVVCADVLEHTVNPSSVLRRLSDSATPDAHFIVSLPNAVHLSARVAVALGVFPQHSRGIFDRTHLHFYTRRTASALLESAGLAVVQQSTTPVPFELVLNLPWQRPLLAVIMWLQRPLVWLLPTLFAYQWIVVGARAGSGKAGIAQSSAVPDEAPAASAPQPEAPAPTAIPSAEARNAATRRLLLALIVALIALPLASAGAGLRLIAIYAARPALEVQIVREVRYVPEGDRPMSGAQGLAVGADGTVFVADESPRRFLAFADNGAGPVRVLASATTVQALAVAYAVAIAPNGEVFLLDRGTGNVHVFSADGAFIRTAKISIPEARGMAFDADGNLYLLETALGRVRKLKPDFAPDDSWGDGRQPATTLISGDTGGIAVIGHTVFVSRAEYLVRLDAQGKVEARIPHPGNHGMLGTDGTRLFMSDIVSNRMWVFDARGNPIARVVGPGGEESIFDQPRGIAIDARGQLFVVNDTKLTVYKMAEAVNR